MVVQVALFVLVLVSDLAAAQVCPLGSTTDIQDLTPVNPQNEPIYRNPVNSTRSWLLATGFRVSSNPGALWHDEYSNNLFYAVSGEIRRFSLDSFPGGTSWQPAEVTVVSAGAVSIATDLFGTTLFFAQSDGEVKSVTLDGKATQESYTGTADVKAVYRREQHMYAADYANDCVVKLNGTSSSNYFERYGCACNTGPTSSKAGSFSTCQFLKPRALSSTKKASSIIGYVLLDNREVYKMHSSSVSLLFTLQTADMGTFAGGFLAHPTIEDTLWITGTSATSALFYRAKDDVNNAVTGVIKSRQSSFRSDFACKARIRANFAGATINWRTGEILLADASSNDRYIRRLKGLWNNTATGTAITKPLSTFRTWQSSVTSTGAARVHCVDYHAATRTYYFAEQARAFRAPVNADGNIASVHQISSDSRILGHACAVNVRVPVEFHVGTSTQILRMTINVTTGNVSISKFVAGQSTPGYDNGVALGNTLRNWFRMYRVNEVYYGTQREDHCVRYYDAHNDQLDTFLGTCGTQGDQDGNLSTALFDTPSGIAFLSHVSNRVSYVSQDPTSSNVARIRRIDLAFSTVTSMPQLLAGSFTSVMAHPTNEYAVYAVCSSACSDLVVAQFDFSANDTQRLVQAVHNISGAVVSPGALSSVSGGGSSMMVLDESTGDFILADYENKLLRRIDSLADDSPLPTPARNQAYLSAESSYTQFRVGVIDRTTWERSISSVNGVTIHPITGVIYSITNDGTYGPSATDANEWAKYASFSNSYSTVFDTKSDYYYIARRTYLGRMDHLRSTNSLSIVAGGYEGTNPIEGRPSRIGEWRKLALVDRTIFAADTLNHCIWSFNIETRSAYFYACQCGKGPGTSDGTFQSCKMSAPTGIAFMNNWSSAVGYATHSTKGDGRVRKLNAVWGSVTTIYRFAGSSVELSDVIAHPAEADVIFVSNIEVGARAVTLLRQGEMLGDGIMQSQTRAYGLWDTARLTNIKQMWFDNRTGVLAMADNSHKSIQTLCCIKFNASLLVTPTKEMTSSAESTFSNPMSRTVSSRGTRSHSPMITVTTLPKTTHSHTPTTTATPLLIKTRSHTATITATALPTKTITISFPSSTSASFTGPLYSTTSQTLSNVANTTVSVTLQLTATASRRSTTTKSRTHSDTVVETLSKSAEHSLTSTVPYVMPTPAPPLKPGERCDPPPTFGSAQLLTDEAVLRQYRYRGLWNGSAELLSSGRLSVDAEGVVNDTDIVITFRYPHGRAPADTGFADFTSAPLYRIPNATLTVSNLPDRGGRPDGAVAQLAVSFGPFPGYDIVATPEAVDVWLLPAWFLNGTRFCGAQPGQPLVRIATVTVEPAADRLLADTKVVNEVIGDTALVASVAAGGGGGAAAGDVTSVAILSSMSCARPGQREAGSNNRLLSPLPLNDTPEGMLGGNLILSLVVVVVHSAVTLGLVCFKGAWRLPLVALAITRFPSWTVALLGVLHQGTAFLSLRLVAGGASTSGAGGVALGAFGMLYSVAMPCVAVAMGMRKIDAVFVEYDYAKETDDRPQGPPKRWLQVLLPHGRWEPREMRRAYGVMLSPFAKTNPLWFLFAFLSPSMIAVGASPSAEGSSACMQQYGWIAGLQAVYVVMLIAFRPYRSVFGNVTAALSASTVSMVALASVWSIAEPTSKTPVTFSAGVMLFQGFVTVLRVAYTVLCVFGESKLLRGVFLRPTLRRCPQRHPFDVSVASSRPPLDHRYFAQTLTLPMEDLEELLNDESLLKPMDAEDPDMLLEPTGGILVDDDPLFLDGGGEIEMAELDSVLGDPNDGIEEVNGSSEEAELESPSAGEQDDEASGLLAPMDARTRALSKSRINKDDIAHLLKAGGDGNELLEEVTNIETRIVQAEEELAAADMMEMQTSSASNVSNAADSFDDLLDDGDFMDAAQAVL